MKTVKKMIVALCAVMSGVYAWAASTPFAVWEGNFNTTQDGCTLNLNSNSLSDDKGTITIDSTTGLGVNLNFATATNGATVIFQYAGLTTGSKDKVIASSTVSNTQNANRTGVRLTTEGKINGNWGDSSYGTAAGSVSKSGYLAFVYSTAGTYLYQKGDSGYTQVWGNGGLKSSDDKSVYGLAIGGPHKALSSYTNATDMTITKIAVFEGALNTTALSAYKWPSEIPTASYSSGFDTNGVNVVASPTVGGTAMTFASGGDFTGTPTYVAVRGSDTNKALTIADSAKPYNASTMVGNGDFSVLTVAKLYEIFDSKPGVIASVGGASWSGGQCGITLVYAGDSKVKLLDWKKGTGVSAIITKSVANAETQYHSYLITYDNTNSKVQLYVDGEAATNEDVAVTYTPGRAGLQLGGIYGGTSTISDENSKECAVGTNFCVDDFAVWTNACLSATQASKLPDAYPLWPVTAQYNGTKYATVQAAIDAIGDETSAEITLIDASVSAFTIPASKSITIKGAYDISGAIAVSSGGTLTIDGNDGTPTVSCVISGAGAVVVTNGTVTLSGSNTFTGGLTVKSGATVISGSSSAFGASTNSVTVEDGGAVDLKSMAGSYGYNYTIAGTGVNNSGAMYSSTAIGSNQRQSLSITLSADATIKCANNWGLIAHGYGATTLDLGGHALTKTGSANFWVYTTTIKNGTIKIEDGALSFYNDSVTISSEVTFEIPSGSSFTLPTSITLADSGSIKKTGVGTLIIPTISNESLSITAAEGIVKFSGTYSGSLTVKSGATVDVDTTRDLTSLSGSNITFESGAIIAATETKAEYANAQNIVFSNVPSSMSSITINRADGTTDTAEVSEGSATYTKTSTAVIITDYATVVDVTFTNATVTTDSSSAKWGVKPYSASGAVTLQYDHDPTLQGTYTEGESNKDVGIDLYPHPWLNNAESYLLGSQLTMAVVGTMPSTTKTMFLHFGGNTSYSGTGIALATGNSANEVAVYSVSGATISEITTMTVPNASTARHAYIITKDDTVTDDKSVITVYLDGIKWKTVELDKLTFTASNNKVGIQVASDFGGNLSRSSVLANVTTANSGIINVMRIYDRVITTAEVNKYSASDEFPYVSPSGSSSRTLTDETANFITDVNDYAWECTAANGTKSTNYIPLSGAALTLTGDEDVSTTFTINLDGQSFSHESLIVGGAKKLTLTATDDSKLTFSSSVIGCPVVIKYGTVDIHGGPTTFTEEGSVDFDLSSYDFSEVDTTTTYELTGETTEEDGKVTISGFNSTYRTAAVSFDEGKNQYVFTVTPNHENGDRVYLNSTAYLNGTMAGNVYVEEDGAISQTATAIFPNDTLVITSDTSVPTYMGTPATTKLSIETDFSINSGDVSNALDGFTITIADGKKLTLSNGTHNWSMGTVTVNGDGTLVIANKASATAINGSAAIVINTDMSLTVGTALTTMPTASEDGYSISVTPNNDGTTTYTPIKAPTADTESATIETTGTGDNAVTTVEPKENAESIEVTIPDSFAGKIAFAPAAVGITTISGTIEASKLELKASYNDGEAKTANYAILKIENNKVVLDSTKSVTIDSAEIKVTPEAAEVTVDSETVAPMGMSESGAVFGVKTIPGLYYAVQESSDPSFPTEDGSDTTTGTATQATGTAMKLTGNAPTGKVKYYRLSVSPTGSSN